MEIVTTGTVTNNTVTSSSKNTTTHDIFHGFLVLFTNNFFPRNTFLRFELTYGAFPRLCSKCGGEPTNQHEIYRPYREIIFFYCLLAKKHFEFYYIQKIYTNPFDGIYCVVSPVSIDRQCSEY